MSKSLKRVIAALDAAGLHDRVREMPHETRTAAEAAAAVGCAIDQIAKSIVFQTVGQGVPVLFLTVGGQMVDPVRAADCVGQELTRADAGRVRAHTGFVIGGVAPVGHLTSISTFMDRRLFDFEVVWAAAGTPRHIFSISPDDLNRISHAQVSDFM